MPKILVVSDDEKIVCEVFPIYDPMAEADDDLSLPYAFGARCRSCPWNSVLADPTERLYESESINDALSHLDSHERVS